MTARYAHWLNADDARRDSRERSDSEEAAYRRWRKAVEEMGLKAGAVIATVCQDAAPDRKTLPALQQGLDVLIDWYGIQRAAGGDQKTEGRDQKTDVRR